MVGNAGGRTPKKGDELKVFKVYNLWVCPRLVFCLLFSRTSHIISHHKLVVEVVERGMVHLFFGGNSEDSPQSPSKRPFSTHSPSSKPTKRPKSSSFHQSDEQDVDDSTQNAISGPSFSKSGAVTHQNVAQAGKKKARREEAERLLRDRMLLPIWEGKDKIVQAVKDHDTIVILGETGSGKTTRELVPPSSFFLIKVS